MKLLATLIPTCAVMACALVTGCSGEESESVSSSLQAVGKSDSDAVQELGKHLVEAYNDHDQSALDALGCHGEPAKLRNRHRVYDLHLEQLPDGTVLSALKISTPKFEDVPAGNEFGISKGTVIRMTATTEDGRTAAMDSRAAKALDGEWCAVDFEGGYDGVNGW